MTDEDLSALIDGRLEQPRISEVLLATDADPSLADKVERYREQMQGLHTLYDGVLSEPVPPHLLEIIQGASETQEASPRGLATTWRAVAALLGVFVIGLAGGWLGHDRMRSERGPLQAAPGTFAVSAESIPFDGPLRVNTAGASNFVPVGFQNASGAGGPTVQLAYRNPEGKEVTLFVQPHSASSKVPYSTSSQDGFHVLYWIDGPLVYALVGQSDKEQLRELADAFYGSAGLKPASTTAGKP